MQKRQFDEAVARILLKDTRFDRGAYHFLKEVLDFTVENEAVKSSSSSRHVTAEQLLYGFRDYALQEFGPMASTLMNEWGVQSCMDVGDMVFLLIDEGEFGKQDSDKPEDFREVFMFEEAFVVPFIPLSDGKVTE